MPHILAMPEISLCTGSHDQLFVLQYLATIKSASRNLPRCYHTTLVSKLYARNSQERQNTAKQSRINTAQHNRVYSSEKSSSEISFKNWTARSLCNIGTLFRAQKTTTHHHDAKHGRALHISAMHRPHEQSYAHCRAQDSISLHCTLLCFSSPQSKEFHAALDWPGLIPVTLPESLIGRWPLQGKKKYKKNTWVLNRHSLCSEVFSAEFADLDGNVTLLHIIANIYSKYDRRSSEIYLEIWHQFNRNPHFVIRVTGSRSKFNYVFLNFSFWHLPSRTYQSWPTKTSLSKGEAQETWKLIWNHKHCSASFMIQPLGR